MSKSKKESGDQEVLEVLQKLSSISPESRARLASMGCVMPAISGDEIVVRFAYKCSNCGNLALYFLGEKFSDGFGGEANQPTKHVPIDQLPWQQDLPAQKINRAHPRCQHCGNGVALENRCPKEKHVVQVAPYMASRTQTERAVHERRMQRARAGLGDASKAAAIATDPYTASTKRGKISEHYKLSDQARADVDAYEAAGMLVPPQKGA